MIVEIGQFLYRLRGFLPLPGLVLVFLCASPSPLSFLFGTALAFTGEAGRCWALRVIGPKSRAERRTRASRLVREGPYSLVRNPLYLANLVIIAGFLLAANRWVLLAILPLLFLYYFFVAKAEEQFLLQTFPEKAPAYLREVGFFLPRLRRPLPAREKFPFLAWALPEVSTLVAMELSLGLVGLKLFWDLFVLWPAGDLVIP
jgi:protein-S-isoprenylcysteine O-methyltransferase Ste14